MNNIYQKKMNNEIPKCAGCRLAKARVLPDSSATKNIKSTTDGALKKDNLRPGAVVSTDQ